MSVCLEGSEHAETIADTLNTYKMSERIILIDTWSCTHSLLSLSHTHAHTHNWCLVQLAGSLMQQWLNVVFLTLFGLFAVDSCF
jgi:hypothetical protein